MMKHGSRLSSRLRVAILACTMVAGLLVAGGPHVSGQASSTGWKVIAWNNLGMHCMDADFSVFAILPPYNTIQAQVIDNTGLLVTSPSGVQLTYEGVADPAGSINTTSAGKTNFWSAVLPMFGVSLPVDTGLLNHDMPGAANTPQSMIFDSTYSWFIAEGIPLTPYDNAGAKQYYPMMKVTARDASGAALASTSIVLPVSDEMTCTACHASGTSAAAQPKAGWVNMTDAQKDYRYNILRLHDDKQLGSTAYASALAAYSYSASGLEATALGGKPILCAKCHTSEALAGSGFAGIPQLTTSMHSLHATVIDPANGLSMDSSSNRTACYRCHPGSETRCLRGVMGNSVSADGSLAIQCQSCHGTLSAVGSATRTGWFQEPTCQSCHTGTAVTNSGQIRYTTALASNGMPRTAADMTFATSANVPAAGYDLYRFSSGHGGLQCSACHGSTHAVYPTSEVNDNLQSIALQGHVGKIAECNACHTTVPTTTNGGPHGMHPVGQTWVSSHRSAASNRAACQACHGTDYRGTVLSRTFGARSISANGTRNWFQGQQVGCYTCHNGPGGDGSAPAPAVASNLSASTSVGVSKSITLSATDPAGLALTYRIVTQAVSGTVGLVGAVATYFPAAGFAGTDTFTYAAWNGGNDSNLATVTVTVGGGGGGGTVCTVTSSASAPSTATVGTAVAFTGSATPSNCTGSVVYSWNFGDGSAISSSQSPSHIYAAAGTFQWTMTATIAGVVSSKTGSIVVGTGSTCSLTTTASAPSTATVGTAVAFTASATPSNCSGTVAYDWNFGDGTAHSTSRTPSHTYTTANTFRWTMTATIAGVVSTKTGSIVVSGSTSTCSLSSTASVPSTGIVGTPVSFTATATATNCSNSVAYRWTFGDGSNSSSSRTTSHTYSTAATFQWRMTASVGEVTSSKTGSITIAAIPAPTVSSVTSLSNPFRIQINGANFQQGVRVYIGGSSTAWSSVQYVSSSRLILGGDGLSRQFPRGRTVSIRIVNPNGQSVTTSFTLPYQHD
jgi:PKD repeat protein